MSALGATADVGAQAGTRVLLPFAAREAAPTATPSPAPIATSTPFASGQWRWENPLPSGDTLYAVAPLSSSIIVAVGGRGAILHSTDGGATWSRRASGTEFALRTISSGGPGDLWVAGLGNALLRSSDGGRSWSRLSSQATFRRISAVSPLVAWAVAWDSVPWRSVDGGVTWLNRVGSSRVVGGDVIVGRSENEAYVLGAAGRIDVTTDGGTTWSELRRASGPYLLDLSIVSSDVMWGAGMQGSVARTTSSARRWTTVTSPTTADLSSILGVSATDAWVSSASGEVFRTTDGGSTWTRQLLGPGESFLSLRGTPTNLWAVGGGEAIYRSADGATWSKVHPFGASGWLNGIAALTDTNVVAVGRGGLTLRTADAGVTWETVPSGTTNGLKAVAAASSTGVWAVGDGGTILASDDGGATWSARSSGTTAALRDVTAGSAAIGWAVGDGGTLLKTSDGARTWSPVAAPTSVATWGSVKAVDERIAWMVSYDPGAAARTLDGGATWQVFAVTGLGNCANCYGRLAAASDRHAWYVNSEQLVRTQDGGATWQTIQIAGLFGLVARSASELWAAGNSTKIARSLDAGLSWTIVAPTFSADRPFTAIAISPGGRVWAAGTGGMIVSGVPAGTGA